MTPEEMADKFDIPLVYAWALVMTHSERPWTHTTRLSWVKDPMIWLLILLGIGIWVGHTLKDPWRLALFIVWGLFMLFMGHCYW